MSGSSVRGRLTGERAIGHRVRGSHGIDRRLLAAILSLGALLPALSGCSWFDAPEPKQHVVVLTTPRVPSFPTEADAKAACASQAVVWGDSTALVYHPGGSPAYGKTNHGGFMCLSVAERGGYRAAPTRP